MTDGHRFENLPVLLILEIRDQSYMFYRRTYHRYQLFNGNDGGNDGYPSNVFNESLETGIRDEFR